MMVSGKLCSFSRIPWRAARTSIACHFSRQFDSVQYFSMKVKPPAPPWSSGDKKIERSKSRNGFEGPHPQEPLYQQRMQDYDVEKETENFSPRMRVNAPGASRMRVNRRAPLQVEREKTSEFERLRDDNLQVNKKPQDRQYAFEISEGSEILFGVAPCHLALSQSRRNFTNLFIKSTLKTQRPEIQDICAQALARGLPMHHVKGHLLSSLCQGRVHQGVCMEVSPLHYTSVDDTAEDLAESGTECLDKPLLWLVLQGIHDPMNMGAILRTAYFLGVDKVVTSQTNSCPLTPVVSKASAGTMELLEVYGTNDLPAFLQAKVGQGWQVAGTAGKTEAADNVPVINPSEFQWSKPTLLVLVTLAFPVNSHIEHNGSYCGEPWDSSHQEKTF
ncbi:rRNA methyltransferase 1, mitochondrial isoform X2 [Ambystoma mexicanum]|uniref:rRNA methyltransferase 1, mitochondrial isoform X2 n=1 Tax=Ambystoma mexicanum TaxID=8296 RepID=UPI0037E9054A